MSQLSSDLAERHARPVARAVDACVAQSRHRAERAAQGLPAHLEDPAVAARVVALLLLAGSTTNRCSSGRSMAAPKAGGAK